VFDLQEMLPRQACHSIPLLLSFCAFILGKPGIAAGEPVLMRGELDFIQKTATVRFISGTEHHAVFQVRPVSDSSIQILAELDNWPVRLFNISTVLEASLNMVPDGEAGPGYSGQLRSRNVLFNKKPLDDISARFVFKNQAVFIERLSWGNCVMSGTWEWARPHRFRLSAEFADVPLYDLVSLFMDVPRDVVEGASAGKIRLSGNDPDVKLQAEVFLTNGCIGDLEYRQLRLKGEGVFPKFRITDSFVSQADGLTFKVAGLLNLARLDKIPQQLRSLRRKPVVRSSGMETEWTLKRIESDDKSGTTELKYLYRRKENINTMSDEDVDMIGVEQKLKF